MASFLKLLQIFICLYFGSQLSVANTSYGNKVNKSLPRPNEPMALSPITDGSIFIFWDKVADAIAYSVRAYNVRMKQLVQHKDFVQDTHANISKLEKYDGHRITVAAIFDNARFGGLQESEQSVPLFVTDEEVCKGGQQLSGCMAHCVSTCETPDPVCDRRCTSGCQCPNMKPFWDGEKCQASYMCPIVQGNVLRPQNLQIFSDDTDNVILTWDRIEGVDEFMVQVMKENEEGDVVMQMPVSANMALLQGLVRGTKYVFKVSTVNKYQNEIQDENAMSRSLTPPKKMFAYSIYQSGFQAYWVANPSAIRYKVRLLGSDKSTVLYANENVAAPSMHFKDLSPSTLYYVQVASAKKQEKFGKYSEMYEVQTKGGEGASQFGDEGSLSSSIVLDFEEKTTTEEPTTPKPTTPKPTTPKPTTQEPTTPEPTTPEPKTEAPRVAEKPSPETPMFAPTQPPKELSLCQQKYKAAVQLAATLPIAERSGVVYPKCQPDGKFKNTVCDKEAPFYCHCVDENTGDEIKSSNFGALDAMFPITCNDYGESDAQVSNLKVISMKENSITLSWDASMNSAGFIIKVYNGDKLVLVKVLIASKYFNVNNLKPKTIYKIQVDPVDFIGKVGKGLQTTGITKASTPMKNLVVNDMRYGRNQVDLSWSAAGYSTYSISLLDCNDNLIEEKQVKVSRATLTNVTPLLCQKVVIKDLKKPYATPLEKKLDRACNNHPVDLILAFDSSMNGPEIRKTKRFFYTRRVAMNLANSITPASNMRVAAVEYWKKARINFHLSKYTTSTDLYAAIKKMKLLKGQVSNVLYTLNYIDLMFFSNSNQYTGYVARANSLPVVVLFTGGKAADLDNRARSRAQSLREKGVTIVVVGTKENKSAIEPIASTKELSFAADTSAELLAAGKKIQEMTCLL